MTYLEQAVSAVEDIPAVIASFAAQRGWTVAGLDITRPGGGRTFTLSSSSSSTMRRVLVADKLVPGRVARISGPRRGGTAAAPIHLAPTKVHLFGNNAPFAADTPPYIAVVIEFGYNVYRHIYIGNMVKMGNYEGGEIISSNSWCDQLDTTTRNMQYNNTRNKYLFSCQHSHSDTNLLAGGVNIEHPDNAVTFRQFEGPVSSLSNVLTLFAGDEVFGGWSDNINAGLATAGLAGYAASVILTPINLFMPATGGMGTNYRFRPLGHVPGVRLIRMDGIDPGEVIEVGSKNWMILPEFTRDSRTSTIRDQAGASGYYYDYETSYLLGLAYAMD